MSENINVVAMCEGLNNYNILKSMLKAHQVIQTHYNIGVSVSGGGDSDIMLDMIERVKGSRKVTYYFVDTGTEYQATKDHLEFLEKKYGVEIVRLKPNKPIPLCVKQHGQPFISKRVSSNIQALQRAEFGFENLPYEELLRKYPKIQKSALHWWCNDNKIKGFKDPTHTMYNICYKKYLKEFMVENPPTFKISANCCTYSKKDPLHKFQKEGNFDLLCNGVRQAEGGNRAVAYKSCFDDNIATGNGEVDNFRPIFWLTDQDKKDYEQFFGVTHSACYTKYGLKRTGCVGCPFNINVLDELETVEQNEPKLHKACTTIFKDSYEYTKQFYEFRNKMKLQEQIEKERASGTEQLRIDI